MQTKEKELKKEEQKEEYRREKGEGNKAKSLWALWVLDVLLVFSWETDNQCLTTSLYHLTGCWVEKCGWMCGLVGVVIVMEIECHSKNRKDPGAEHRGENHQHVILCVLYIFC